MVKNNINFITGETYTLAELFSGNRRIIIPDLQRDYCWGDENNQKSTGERGELVTDFVKNLILQYEHDRQGTLNIGLFYGYEVPANHIQLCDGQQRLTTLYLLLGMLNRRCDNAFRLYLISDYEYKHDDKEPYLNYAIRETSLYFMSDLVCNFFIPGKGAEVKNIKDADWYFHDYELDPSIQSMINALDKIDAVLNSENRVKDCPAAFGDWLVNKLTFLYFDMENRKNGEETFVVINTTGEPLSAAQNLKPLVVNEKINTEKEKPEDIARKWEEIETWFWRKRQGENDTADAGFEEFLRWVMMIECKDIEMQQGRSSDKNYIIQSALQGNYEFPYTDIPFATIYDYWQALKWIDKNCEFFKQEWLSPKDNKQVNNRKALSQNDCFKLLPLLYFVRLRMEKEIPTDDLRIEAIRIYRFFENLIRLDNVSKAVNTLVREALKVVELVNEDGGDILSVLNHADSVSTQLLTDEEKRKLQILKDTDRREDVEMAFRELQARDLWHGKILPVINWSTEGTSFNFIRFQEYTTLLELVEAEKHTVDLDLLRRCIIVNQADYKPVRRGAYLTFGWTWDDWHELLCRDNSRIVQLWDYIIQLESTHGKSVEEAMEAYIEESKDKDKAYMDFAESDYLLSFTWNSRACDIFDNGDLQICDRGSLSRHTSFFSRKNAFILQAFGGTSGNRTEKNKKPMGMTENWYVFFWSESNWNCVVFQADYGIKLDVRYIPNADDKKGNLEIYLKPVSDENKEVYDKIAERLTENKVFNNDYTLIKYEMPFEVNKIKDRIACLIKEIDGFREEPE